MNSVRWGIIGCGDVTEVKSGPGFAKATGSALVAVMRRSADKARDYARRHNVPRWYDDADKLIADEHVDAVYVATPPDTHELYALKVAAAGKPCLVEKPMARNTAEAQRMLAAFEAADLPLFVAYYRRAMPRFRKVAQILQSGELGPIRRATYRLFNDHMKRSEPVMPWRLDPAVAGAGLFLDVGSHALDLLDFFLGPLGQISGKAQNLGGKYLAEDSVELSFTTDRGIPGHAQWSFISDHKIDEFHFVGEKGQIRFSCFTADPIILEIGSQTQSIAIAPPPHVHQPLIQMAVDELNAVPGSQPMPSTGQSALRTQRVMDAALHSYYRGREDGCWDRMRAGNSSIPST